VGALVKRLAGDDKPLVFAVGHFTFLLDGRLIKPSS
jgi:hypothetical protein